MSKVPTKVNSNTNKDNIWQKGFKVAIEGKKLTDNHYQLRQFIAMKHYWDEGFNAGLLTIN